MRRFGFSLATFLVGVALAGRAAANEPDLAEQLFREGHALLKEHRYPEACSKFADSQRHDPASGTLLALAYCQELANLLASAQASYVAAAELARVEHQDERQRAATERAQSLAERVSTLTINVPESLWELPTLLVKSNGVELERSVWGRPIPRDGGDIEIDVSASARSPWSSHVQLAPEHDQRVVTVPPLGALSQASLVAPPAASLTGTASAGVASNPPVPADRYWTTPRIAGWAAVGVGAAAGIGALYFAVSAKSAQNDVQNMLNAEEKEPATQRVPWDLSGHAREVDGRHAQALAQGFGVASGALLVGGAALLIFGTQKKNPEAPSVSLAIVPGAGQINYAGAF
jgi:hypothetical protein